MNNLAKEIFSQLILPDRTLKIKLLGDSITHGMGGTGFRQSGEHIVDKFHRNPDGYCWAKLFADFMESGYDCVVTNNACTGTGVQFTIDNFDALVSEDDDIVICNIGTNDRHQNFADGPRRTRREQAELFYNRLLTLNSLFVKAGKPVIFIANIPTAAYKETDGESWWRILHMNDIHDLYRKACCDVGLACVDLYTRFIGYCECRGITVDSLLADGLHPNDEGYRVMFALIVEALGLARPIDITGA